VSNFLPTCQARTVIILPILLLTESVDNLVNNVWKKCAITDELGGSANWFNFEPDKINPL
jgi:hypothetical protein